MADNTRCAECNADLRGKRKFQVTVGHIAKTGPGKVGVERSEVIVCLTCSTFHHQPVEVTT